MDKIVISIILGVFFIIMCAIFFNVLCDNYVKKRKEQIKQDDLELAIRIKKELDESAGNTYKRARREPIHSSSNSHSRFSSHNSFLPNDISHHSGSVSKSSFDCFSGSSDSSCGGGGGE